MWTSPLRTYCVLGCILPRLMHRVMRRHEDEPRNCQRQVGRGWGVSQMKLDAPRRVHDRRKRGRIITSWCPAEVLRNPVRPEQIQIQNFIDSQFVPPIAGKYLDNIEPATGNTYSLVPDSDSR